MTAWRRRRQWHGMRWQSRNWVSWISYYQFAVVPLKWFIRKLHYLYNTKKYINPEKKRTQLICFLIMSNSSLFFSFSALCCASLIGEWKQFLRRVNRLRFLENDFCVSLITIVLWLTLLRSGIWLMCDELNCDVENKITFDNYFSHKFWSLNANKKKKKKSISSNEFNNN